MLFIKRIALVILTLFFAAAFVACGSSSPTTGTKGLFGKWFVATPDLK